MKCSENLRTALGRCNRDATVERDGKPYCWQHDPERLQEATRKRWDERKAQLAEMDRKFDRNDLERSAGLRPEQIARLTDDQLRWIADAGGLTAFICEDDRG